MLSSLLILSIGKVLQSPNGSKSLNPLLRRSIDILSDDPAADPAAEPGAAPEVDPAADLADQVRWRRWRTFLCEERRVVHRLLDILQSEASSKASLESYRDDVKPETGYLGSCHSTKFPSVRGTSKKFKLPYNQDSTNTELLPCIHHYEGQTFRHRRILPSLMVLVSNPVLLCVGGQTQEQRTTKLLLATFW